MKASGGGPRYVVVTGGVLSGLGKGIVTSSIGRLLIMRGLKVSAVKIDPYINLDAGTMNPFEHGEVFVLKDGAEVDLDLGNYERFLEIELGRDNNITTGKAYKTVIEKERRGDYLGKTVQIVPHVTDVIREWVQRVGRESGADVCLVEVGGTVGDIESMPFLEALRQLHREEGHQNVMFVHTTLLPVLGPVGEQKTKPTQHSVRELQGLGLHPDVIVCRSNEPMDPTVKVKVAQMCDVENRAVIGCHDCPTHYDVPLLLHAQGLDQLLIDRLRLEVTNGDQRFQQWADFVERIKNPERTVNVAIIGKYTHLADSYLSITESFRHAGAELGARVRITWVESEDLERNNETAWKVLRGADGVLVPGGFGGRGVEGKIAGAGYARTNGVPFLGICYGFQLALIEFARSELGLEDANSTEIDPKTPHDVITLLPEQYEVLNLGGTMRLGASDIDVKPDTLAHQLYGDTHIRERHRHRFEVNPEYIERFESKGIVFSGRMPGQPLMEIMELPRAQHPFFIGGQFHPEFLSRPRRPAPLFRGFVEAMVARQSASAGKASTTAQVRSA